MRCCACTTHTMQQGAHTETYACCNVTRHIRNTDYPPAPAAPNHACMSSCMHKHAGTCVCAHARLHDMHACTCMICICMRCTCMLCTCTLAHAHRKRQSCTLQQRDVKHLFLQAPVPASRRLFPANRSMPFPRVQCTGASQTCTIKSSGAADASG